MTTEQLEVRIAENSKSIAANSKDIAALSESNKSAHKRIDDNDRTTEGIHKLAVNVESLTLQIKHLTESHEENSRRLEASIRSQGERIGALEKKPAMRWEGVVTQVITLAVATVVGGLFTRFL